MGAVRLAPCHDAEPFPEGEEVSLGAGFSDPAILTPDVAVQCTGSRCNADDVRGERGDGRE